MGALPTELIFWGPAEDTEVIDDRVDMGEGGQLSKSPEQYVAAMLQKRTEIYTDQEGRESSLLTQGLYRLPAYL